jgi:cation:H+ antiporter
MLIINLLLYIISFTAIWFGAGIIIKSVSRIARRLKLSSFAFSFFLLGLLTSLPETAIGTTAVLKNTPEIFIGTLLGGTIVIFLFIIPFLAILGNGIRINHELDHKIIIYAMAVMALPGLLIIDRKLTNFEGLLMISLYAILFYFIEKRHGILDRSSTEVLEIKAYSFIDLLKVAAGILLVILSSQYIVHQTILFSRILNISTLYISLIVLSIGTNLPELSLAVRAILSGKKDIAFGDYLGSAAANTLIFGIFTIISHGDVFTSDSFLMTFIFTIIGLGLFYYFSKSRKDISRKEALILFGIYLLFIIYEVVKSLTH